MALENLRDAGCQTAYIDGSFGTDKEHPNDYDACWEEAGVDPYLLDPVLLTFDLGRATQKAKYLGGCSSPPLLQTQKVCLFWNSSRRTGIPENRGNCRHRSGGTDMIKNERQYRITRVQVRRFERSLEVLLQSNEEEEDIHPLIAKAREDAIRSQLSDLRSELREYEALKAGDFELDQLGVVSGLPAMLIKARIARGMSQRDLAERIGLKEQQIQRYEATDYASVSLSRIKDIVGELSEENSLHG
ncbi:MAG: helix-turn-helix domain-containing protein [Chloroflexi bacterium]|nr:helix-turn-helix domain-containing protein [Chloroflexota bacterium]